MTNPFDSNQRVVDDLSSICEDTAIPRNGNGMSKNKFWNNGFTFNELVTFYLDNTGKILSVDVKDKDFCNIPTDIYVGLPINELQDKDNIFTIIKDIFINPAPQPFYWCKEQMLYFFKNKFHYTANEPSVTIINIFCRYKEVTTYEKSNFSKIQLYFKEVFENSPNAILVFDENRKIINCNKNFEKLFQFSFNEIQGMTGDEFLSPGTNENPDSIYEKTRENKKIQKETIRKKKDGSLLHVYLQSDKIRINEQHSGRFIMYSDISSRKRSEEQIISSILEKEVLLKEIHHRVKNNLQIISSMLNFQIPYIKDEASVQMFKDSQNRIKSIALLHEKLYQASDLSRIDLANYIRSLTTYLFNSTGLKREMVTLIVDSENIFLSIDNAIPCGLIINELITNALKYAFPNDMKGEISVQVRYHQNNKFTMIVKDNGIGFPQNIDYKNSDSMGLKLVMILIRQMGATIELDNSNGTEFKIEFSILDYKDRIL